MSKSDFDAIIREQIAKANEGLELKIEVFSEMEERLKKEAEAIPANIFDQRELAQQIWDLRGRLNRQINRIRQLGAEVKDQGSVLEIMSDHLDSIAGAIMDLKVKKTGGRKKK